MGPEDLQVVKYTEATTLSDWAFAHKAPPPHGVPFLFFVVVTGSQAAGVLEC